MYQRMFNKALLRSLTSGQILNLHRSTDIELKSVIESFTAKLNYANLRIRRLENKVEALGENGNTIKSTV